MIPRIKLISGMMRSLLIYHGQPWRTRQRRKFYSSFVGEGDICFDIGSHLGNRIKTLNSLGASVVALEPQPAFFDFLNRIYSGKHKNVILKCGVASKPGRRSLNISDNHPTVSTFDSDWISEVKKDSRFDKTNWNRTVDVEMTTLDHLIDEFGKPKFCKIDVEGLEYEVLCGLSEPVQCISFEYLPITKDRAIQCLRYLAKLGPYRFGVSKAEYMTWYKQDMSLAETEKFLNSLPMGDRSGDIYAQLS